MTKKSENLQKLENGPLFEIEQNPELQNENEVFQELSPNELQNLLDKDEAERLGGNSISIRDFERSGIHPSSSTKKKIPDFSMGQYFENRSSYPFSILNGNITVMSDPPYPQDLPEKDSDATQRMPTRTRRSMQYEQTPPFHTALSSTRIQGMTSMGSIADTPQVRKKPCPNSLNALRRQGRNSMTFDTDTPEKGESFTQSMEKHNGSINSLVEFFADPEKSPLTSTAILDHVLQYCKTRSNNSQKSKSSNENGCQGDHDSFKIQSTVNVNQISLIDNIEQPRRLHESDLYSNYSKQSSKMVMQRRTNSLVFLEEEESQKNDSESYEHFSEPLTRKQRLSRCSTPDTSSPCSSRENSRKSISDQVEVDCQQQQISTLHNSHAVEQQIQINPLQHHVQVEIDRQQQQMTSLQNHVQVQLNLPNNGTTVQNFPLVINISIGKF